MTYLVQISQVGQVSQMLEWRLVDHLVQHFQNIIFNQCKGSIDLNVCDRPFEKLHASFTTVPLDILFKEIFGGDYIFFLHQNFQFPIAVLCKSDL